MYKSNEEVLHKELIKIANKLYKVKKYKADAIDLYEIANFMWDDAIHIPSPLNKKATLCGARGRNMITEGENWPDAGAGCWTCLTIAKEYNKTDTTNIPTPMERLEKIVKEVEDWPDYMRTNSPHLRK